MGLPARCRLSSNSAGYIRLYESKLLMADERESGVSLWFDPK